MRFGRYFAAAGVALLGAAVAAPAADAQSLLAGRGLGYVVEPLDARARGLGGVGLGLQDPSLSMINPASVAGIVAPVLHVTVQPDRFSSAFGTSEVSTETVRFPIIHAALPFRRFTATIGYSSFLDRNWAAESDTTLVVGGSTIEVQDRFASRGGVARLRIGGAYAVLPRLAIGASADVYSGSVQDTTYRIFGAEGLTPAVSASSLGFRGLGYGAGARWVPGEEFAMEASVSAGGQLDIRTGDTGDTRTFDLPVQGAVGASAQLTPNLMLALSGRWSGWSSVDGALADQGGARDTWSVSGGVEWDALRFGNQVVPVRIGARHGLLPFRWDDVTGDDGWADERAFTLGAGLRLGGGAALIDAGLERGERGGNGAGLTESFWRMAISLTVLGR